MVQVLSKILTAKFGDSCVDILHPSTTSCVRNYMETWCYSYWQCVKLYSFYYALNFSLKCKLPTIQDLLHTVKAILRSAHFYTILLTSPNFGFCIFGNMFNNFNILVCVIIANGICSLLSISQEKHSRRPLLALHVCQDATTVIWNLLKSRGLVQPISHGTTILFSVSMAVLLANLKVGLYVNKNAEGEPRVDYLVKFVKGSIKSFMTGIGVNTAMVLATNVITIIRNPKYIKELFLQRKFLSIPLTLMSFTGIFRTVCCSLRWTTGKDNAYHALVAGLLAGTAYSQFNNNTIALYILWKILAVLYKKEIDAGHLPNVPYGHELQFILSSISIIYGLIVEPNSIKPSYWKMIHNLAGGRLTLINRSRLAEVGIDSVKQLETIMRRTNTHHQIKTLFG